MPRFRMLIEYDGRLFSGWQVQPERPTVQQAIEDALEVALRERLEVVGSGRTDAGVHARGQVAHFDLAESVDTDRLMRSLNGLLRPSISVRALEEAPAGFHARYDARMRRYHYYVCTVPTALEQHQRWFIRPAPDFDRMNAAARNLLGRRSFDSFCRTKSETTNRVCTVYQARWMSESSHMPGHSSNWRFEIIADRFLHGMVRTIVGTLVEIGHGGRDPDEIAAILDERDRRSAGAAAPAHGLVLEHVVYDYPFGP